MHPQRQNNHDNPQMEIAMQLMVEVHTEMMQVMTKYMVNCDSKELPPGMQQVMDDHFRIVQMMSQILASTNNNLPQNDLGSKEPRSDAEITLQACKNCREIGHTSKGMS
jgi:division protein CdvB (Snf7/Vps24/ESCRT-III family)